MENSHTTQRYFDDPDCLEFNAKVTEVIDQPDNLFAALLPETYFYPTGGGQEHDTGKIGDAIVKDVYFSSEGRIIHLLDREISPGNYHAEIDADRRLRFMQNHTGQHILSGSFEKLLKLWTKSANINAYSPSTIDLDTTGISEAELRKVEDLANQIVFENREILSYFIDESDISTVPFRKPPVTKGNIRVVEVKGFDYSACCGTHCRNTGSVGIVKVVRLEKIRGDTRVHFIVGRQALEVFQNHEQSIQEASKILGVHPDNLPQGILSWREKLENLSNETKYYRSRYLKSIVENCWNGFHSVKGVRILVKVVNDILPNDLKEIGLFLAEQERGLSVLLSPKDGQTFLVVACGPSAGMSASSVLDTLLMKYGGKGGGNETLSQGRCPNQELIIEDIFQLLEKTFNEPLS